MKLMMILMALTIGKPKEGKTVIVKTFPVENAEKTTVIIDNINGDVEVERSDDELVHLYLEILFEADNDELLAKAKQELKLGEYRSNDSLVFSVKAPFVRKCNWNNGWGYQMEEGEPKYNFKYQYKVKVPKQVSVEAKTVNNGDVLVADVAGPVKVANVNGSVEVKNAMEIMSACTVNGDVTINFLRSPKESIHFNTVNGDFRFTLPDDFRAQVYFESMNGDLFTAFDYQEMNPKVTKSEKNGKFKIASKTGVEIGSGGPELSFKTINGNVYLKKS